VRYPPLLGLFGLLSLTAQSLGAQEVVDPLPVTGSLIYNLVIYDRMPGTRGNAALTRFAGRVALKVAQSTYVGLGGGSWSRIVGTDCAVVPDCDEFATAQSDAIIHQLYLQRYVSRSGLFFRAGAGLASTSTLLPENRGVMGFTLRWRAALSAGVGMDIRLARFLYVTPSLDVTVLPGTDTRAAELRSGIAPGLALTLR
jgi:hypothetical protein